MDPTMAGIIGIIIMVFLFMTRMPVAFVMMLVGFIGFSMLTSWRGGLNLMSRNIYDAFASYELSTIPLFILMGQIAFNCGISRRLYNTAYCFLGNVRAASQWRPSRPAPPSARSAVPARPQPQPCPPWASRK